MSLAAAAAAGSQTLEVSQQAATLVTAGDSLVVGCGEPHEEVAIISNVVLADRRRLSGGGAGGLIFTSAPLRFGHSPGEALGAYDPSPPPPFAPSSPLPATPPAQPSPLTPAPSTSLAESLPLPSQPPASPLNPSPPANPITPTLPPSLFDFGSGADPFLESGLSANAQGLSMVDGLSDEQLGQLAIGASILGGLCCFCVLGSVRLRKQMKQEKLSHDKKLHSSVAGGPAGA